jgi:hypothetical protein
MKVNIGKYHNNGAPRTIKVQIDPWDTVSADHTLALIILPLLKQLKENPHGSSFVDNEDVPTHTPIPEGQEFERSDEWEEWESRWKWVLDEMIFAFEHIVDHEWELMYFGETKDLEGFEKINERIANGLRLFGKYFRGLWT